MAKTVKQVARVTYVFLMVNDGGTSLQFVGTNQAPLHLLVHKLKRNCLNSAEVVGSLT